MPSKSAMAFLDNLILVIVPPFSLQLLQVGLEVKVFDIPACFSFFNGSTESCCLLLILLQPPETGSNYLTGIRVASSLDAGLDKCVEMRS